MGPVAGGMDIGSGYDDDPEQPVAGLISKGESTRARVARAITPNPKPGLGMQQKEVPDKAKAEAGQTKEGQAPEPTWVIEKRKTRSLESAEELELPTSKRN